MMNVKHLLAGTVVTAAVSTALVLSSAVGAQAMIFPPPTPIGPGSVSKPINTVPSMRGFHLPQELWTKYGRQVKPSWVQPYTVLPTCATLFDPIFYSDLGDGGFALTADHTLRATRDPQLLALLASAQSVNCDFVNSATGSHIDISVAVHANDGAVSNRLDALGYSAPDVLSSRTKVFADGHIEAQDVALGRGGWDLTSWDSAGTPTDFQSSLQGTLFQINL